MCRNDKCKQRNGLLYATVFRHGFYRLAAVTIFPTKISKVTFFSGRIKAEQCHFTLCQTSERQEVGYASRCSVYMALFALFRHDIGSDLYEKCYIISTSTSEYDILSVQHNVNCLYLFIFTRPDDGVQGSWLKVFNSEWL